MNAEECRAYAGYLSFAAGLFLNEPSPELMAACEAAGAELSRALPEADFPGHLMKVPGDDLGEVKQEFFDLFFVPLSGSYLPPFEEAHGEDGGRGETRSRLKELYGETGFDPGLVPTSSYLAGLDRPDHIGLEMALLASLLESAAEAEDVAEAELLETAELFCRHHFGQWAQVYGNSLQKGAKTHLYKALGSLTAFLGEAAVELGSAS